MRGLKLSLVALLIAMLGIVLCQAKKKAVVPPDFSSSLYLQTALKNGEIGRCSATSVGEHIILTATHCVAADVLDVSINGAPAKVIERLDDRHDHSLLVLNGIEFAHWAEVNQRPVHQGEEIHMVGNPDGMQHLYRHGWVSGWDIKAGFVLFNLKVSFGDSGSGIFDEDNKLVAVLSVQYQSEKTPSFSMSAGMPLSFSPEQLQKVAKHGR